MYYLYGSKKGVERRLVATLGSEQQLLAYVGWATLKNFGEHRGKFEQGSALASFDAGQFAVLGLLGEAVRCDLAMPEESEPDSH